MGDKSKIEWTDATWNPILGCSRVSEGCRHCYAEGIAGRFGQGRETVYSGLTHIVNGAPVWTGQIRETRQLLTPLAWRRARRIFVNSMSDLFHENVTDAMRDKILAVMALSPRHIFQILTKRPVLMRDYFERRVRGDLLGAAWGALKHEPAFVRAMKDHPHAAYWPLPNVWLGVSVENQWTADERIPTLLLTPAALRFLSCEPLLGPVDLTSGFRVRENVKQDALYGSDGLRWVIAGGESGPHARPMHPDWARGLRDQCQLAGVPFFFKQWGEWRPMYPAPDCEVWGDGQAIVNQTQGDVRGYESLVDDTTWLMERVGKHNAGAALDGCEWRRFPGVCA